MTLVQFLNAMERYSADVLFLAFAVCLATSLLKKIIPQNLKKYLTFAPFVFGCVAYGVYMFVTVKDYQVISRQTVLKGLECGAAATIYYVLFEQFIRGKKNLLGLSDTKQLAVAGMLKNIVTEYYLYSVTCYITGQIEKNPQDISYCTAVCLNTLKGKTQAGVTENDIAAAARLISATLSIIK